jgi:hypothetical protein
VAKKQPEIICNYVALDYQLLSGMTLADFSAQVLVMAQAVDKHATLHNTTISIDYEYDYDDRYIEVKAVVRRPETPEEEAGRLAAVEAVKKAAREEQKKKRLAKEAADRAEYERLRKKFEKSKPKEK